MVVSNHKFYDHFTAWKESCSLSHPVVILDDGSTDNPNRLGAVKDILFAIEEQEIDENYRYQLQRPQIPQESQNGASRA